MQVFEVLLGVISSGIDIDLSWRHVGIGEEMVVFSPGVVLGVKISSEQPQRASMTVAIRANAPMNLLRVLFNLFLFIVMFLQEFS